MAIRPRSNKTPAGAKRRWTSDDRARRDGARAADDTARTGGTSRAARRAEQFADRRPADRDERRTPAPDRTGRPDRRTGWYPGPRDGGERREARDDRRGGTGRGRFDRAGDRPRPSVDRSVQRRAQHERTFRDERPPRDDRPYTDERPRRENRGDRPERPFRAERPARDDRPRREDRPVGHDRAQRTERPDARSGFRDERPARSAHTRDDERSFRNDRPIRNDGPARAERPARDDRPVRDELPRRVDGDRPRQDRPARPAGERRTFDRDDRPTRGQAERRDRPALDRDGQGGRPDHRDTGWTPDEDVVLERLEAETVTAEEVAGATFRDLGLGDGITRALAELGAEQPFPIQAATIPDALAGRDVLGRGRTGSGKTIAFGAAMVERLMRNWHDSGRAGNGRQMGRAPRALVLAPTRELALQIDRTVQPIARSIGLYTTQIVGGVPQGRQVGALKKGVDIVIGTPGRIEDLIEQRHLDLRSIEITVLDEADHMAELGFLEPMQRLLRLVPRGGQRLMFSATLDTAVSALVEEFLMDPAVHEVAEAADASTTVHRVLVIEQGEKLPVLQAMLNGVDRSLVFARTRAFAEQLADDLEDLDVRAESLHGDLNQSRRSRALARFMEGRVRALVATDVAARGIHVDEIDLVVHADAAEDYKTYLHRSGRTGRAGAAGTVVTLITARRRRRFTELLERAEIEADFVTLRPGADPVAALGL